MNIPLFPLRIAVVLIFLMISIGCGSNNKDTATPGGSEEPTEPVTNPPAESEVLILQIRDHKQECIGVSVFPCLYTKITGDSDWSLFYDTISGFEYEWGYNYEIEVKVDSIENPPQDGSSSSYTLLNTISKTAVPAGSLFEYASRFAPEVITKKTANTYSLFSFETKDFICAPTDCDAVDSLLAQQKSILFEFRHADDLAGALVLERIICSDIQTLFQDTCVHPQSNSGSNLHIEFLLLDQFNQASTSFNQSETVTFSFSITNNTSDALSLNFSSGQRFDISILDNDKSELWRWSEDKIFTQALEELKIDTMETIQEFENWDQLLSNGDQLDPGDYTASGYYHDPSNKVDIAFTVR